MGVNILKPLPPDISRPPIEEKTEMKCVKNGCAMAILPLILCHEDEEAVHYNGACGSCGQEYDLTFMKRSN